MAKNLVMVLAGGEGRRLYPLTRDRAKPAVPFGGQYRIVDFVLSNFVNSGYFKIKILTQFMSESLNKHISTGWRLSPTLGHYIDCVPAQMRTGETWFKGTADAIYQNINIIEDENPDLVFVFGGDHIYKMDIRQMEKHHLEKDADVTIAAVPYPIAEASNFGVIVVDSDWRIIGFQEKPKVPKPLPDRSGLALVSMGNYIFKRDALLQSIKKDAKRESDHDFGKSIMPELVKSARVFAYDFSANSVPGMEEKERGYWRDVGTIDAYWEANMELVSVSPQLNLYNMEWPIRTVSSHLPPAKFVFANVEGQRVGYATDSMISEGCIISGGKVHRSILSPGVRVNSYSLLEESILLDGVNIGRHAQIRKTIIDKDVDIPPKSVIGFDLEKDRKRFFVTDEGVVVVPKKTRFDRMSDEKTV
ncbi:MAG: glucose-1-phosphate adenylyltransferase [Chlamydiae bacterium]|nr:glucose-1-phosphate adenylyltransferase [Chlamydiota bacterium]MBI3276721.1 glucose-1-phosphate adenylyltransferase [Chlamydiota bacterium]